MIQMTKTGAKTPLKVCLVQAMTMMNNGMVLNSKMGEIYTTMTGRQSVESGKMGNLYLKLKESKELAR